LVDARQGAGVKGMPRSRGGRALAGFWAALLALSVAVVLWLEMAGPLPAPPPPPAPLAEVPASDQALPLPANALPTVAVGPPPGGAPPAGAAPAPALAPAAPAALPAAPSPPPLAAVAPREPPAGRPRLAVLIHTLGQATAATDAAILLPTPLGLAFSPYDDRSTEAAQRARTRGHQILVSLPMEPATFPLNNPGDRALMVALAPAENATRLAWALERVPGAAGITNALAAIRGERLLAAGEQARSLAEILRARGLFFIEARPGERSIAGVGGTSVDIVLDDQPGAIDARLSELERLARERGSALGLTAPAPLILEKLGPWLAGLEGRGIALVPPSLLLRAGR
jgi:uncharacterized protein